MKGLTTIVGLSQSEAGRFVWMIAIVHHNMGCGKEAISIAVTIISVALICGCFVPSQTGSHNQNLNISL